MGRSAKKKRKRNAILLMSTLLIRVSFCVVYYAGESEVKYDQYYEKYRKRKYIIEDEFSN